MVSEHTGVPILFKGEQARPAHRTWRPCLMDEKRRSLKGGLSSQGNTLVLLARSATDAQAADDDAVTG